MQRLLFLILLMATLASAQQTNPMGNQSPRAGSPTAQITEHNLPVTYSDLYCAGFVSPQVLPRDRFVAAGLETPVQSRYQDRDIIYLRGGEYTPGTRISIVRELRDPNRYTPFPAGKGLLAKTGQLYAELGYATVIEKRGVDVAVAQIEFSCDGIVAGDLAVPFTAKQPLTYRKRSTMDRFPAEHGKVSGRIMASSNFDQFPRSGSKIYVNVGEKSGVKPGDYFRVVRNYELASLDPTDKEAYRQPVGEDTQQKPSRLEKKQLSDLPYRIVGEAVVLNTQQDTATAMITFSMEEMQIGDLVELEEDQSR